jgi:hypothetical protein
MTQKYYFVWYERFSKGAIGFFIKIDLVKHYILTLPNEVYGFRYCFCMVLLIHQIINMKILE